MREYLDPIEVRSARIPSHVETWRRLLLGVAAFNGQVHGEVELPFDLAFVQQLSFPARHCDHLSKNPTNFAVAVHPPTVPSERTAMKGFKERRKDGRSVDFLRRIDRWTQMDVAQAADRLRSLTSDHARRSKTAVLREIFMDIEAAIQAGVSQVVIVEELRTLGLDINHGSFRSALRRLRAKHSSRQPAWSSTSGFSDVASSSYAEIPASVCTTSSGSIYDAEALCRLIRASSFQTEYTPTASSELAAFKANG